MSRGCIDKQQIPFEDDRKKARATATTKTDSRSFALLRMTSLESGGIRQDDATALGSGGGWVDGVRLCGGWGGGGLAVADGVGGAGLWVWGGDLFEGGEAGAFGAGDHGYEES
jgi:hypothetical protein